MYQLGDLVMYGMHGVCKIIDVESRKVDRKTAEYFILEPLSAKSSRFYIPTQNKAALEKLHPLLTAGELIALLKAVSADKSIWNDDESKRKQQYRELMVGNDQGALIHMVCSVHRQRAILENEGKKLHMCDINFLKDAERVLCMEFSVVFNIEPAEVMPYIHNLVS